MMREKKKEMLKKMIKNSMPFKKKMMMDGKGGCAGKKKY